MPGARAISWLDVSCSEFACNKLLRSLNKQHSQLVILGARKQLFKFGRRFRCISRGFQANCLPRINSIDTKLEGVYEVFVILGAERGRGRKKWGHNNFCARSPSKLRYRLVPFGWSRQSFSRIVSNSIRTE